MKAYLILISWLASSMMMLGMDVDRSSAVVVAVVIVWFLVSTLVLGVETRRENGSVGRLVDRMERKLDEWL